MTDLQKKYVLRGAMVVLVVCMISWLLMLFWPRSQAPGETLPSIIEAGRPQYNYNDSSYIQQNPEMFLAQILPLLGNVEAAAQRGDMAAIEPSALILRKEIMRWHDATDASVLRTTIQEYAVATDAAIAASKANDKDALARALGKLQEIKTLALTMQRSDLQSSLLQ